MIINNEFKQLISPLQEDEYSKLEESILSEGCRDNLIVWNEVLIDGHNRYEICKKHTIPFGTTNKSFADNNEAKIWIINNQFGRRNLPIYERARLALQLESIFSQQAVKNMKLGGKGCQISDNLIIDTKKELAKMAGVSHDTISKVKAIEREVSVETKAKLANGALSINEVYKELNNAKKIQNRVADIQKQKAKIENKLIYFPIKNMITILKLSQEQIAAIKEHTTKNKLYIS